MQKAANYEKIFKISGFILKILAIVLMTLDHVGALLTNFYAPDNIMILIFRGLGRISLPLFCFLIFEGVMHTRNFGKYALRLGICLTLISIMLIVMNVTSIMPFEDIQSFGNIFIDLLLGATAVYLLKHKKPGLKVLALLPIGYSIASYVATSLESTGRIAEVYWIPYFLRCQYGFYAVGLIIGFYLMNLLYNVILEGISKKMGLMPDNAEEVFNSRLLKNGLFVLFLFALTAVFHFTGADYLVLGGLDRLTLCAFVGGIFILFYNGKRGYNKAWFKYGSYAYYPLHILILFLVYLFITL